MIGSSKILGPSFVMKTIFVGHLDFHVAEDDLRQLFAQFGQVDRVSVMTDRDTGRSRGFAFVEMTNNEEGEKAIAELNGSQLAGRTLNVNEARPKMERGGGRNSRFDRASSRRRERASESSSCECEEVQRSL
jgi:RNA recognition motif-containing protein